MRREKKSSEEEAPKGRFHSELFDWGEALILSLTIVILVFVIWRSNYWCRRIFYGADFAKW